MARVPEVTGDRPAPGTTSVGSHPLEDRAVLVTGAQGFVGRHVVRELVEQGARVTATSRRRPGPTTGGAGAGGVDGDLTDPGFVRSLVDNVRPDVVIHLAAVTRPVGTDDGLGGFGDTLRATSGLVAALTSRSPGTRLVVLSSSAVYGCPVALPVNEHAEVRPVTAYGVSKASQELLAQRAQWAGELHVTILRAFNLVGPDLPENLLLGSVASQLAEAAAGGRSTVEVGNLEPRRDYLDVRDAADALVAVAACANPPALANVASGRSWSVAEVVQRMVALAEREVEIRQSAARRRAIDIPEQVGDSALLRDTTGWVPRIDMDDSLRDMLKAAHEPRDGEST